MPYIYKIVNLKNNKIYVGKTKRSSLKRRWYEHRYKSRNKKYRHPLYDGIRHYGVENFSIEVLEECDLDSVNEREIYWIEELNPEYNLTLGGEGGDTFSMRSDESKEITRKKLSENSKRLWDDLTYREKVSKGLSDRWKDPKYREKMSKKLSDKWDDLTYREKVSKGLSDRWKDPEYREKVSRGVSDKWKDPKYREKMSKIMSKTAIENRETWSECKRGSKNGRWLGRIQFMSPEGDVIKEFESAVEAHKDLGIAAQNIRNKARSGDPMLRGKYSGHFFKFCDEQIT